jgi:hypothetical protein
MSNLITQLEGSIKIAVTGGSVVEYGSFVPKASVTIQRLLVTRPGTLGNSDETEVPAQRKRMLNIDLFSTTEADSILGVLVEAIESDAGTIDFEFTPNDDALSSDNAKYSGTAVVPQIDIGHTVGELRTQSVTCPITVWGAPDVTP